MKTWLLSIGLLSLAACGGAGAAGGPSEHASYEAESPLELEDQQTSRVEQLDTALALTEPDCDEICGLGEVICDLRDRICGIADRNPGDAETQGRCRDAAERCDRGRERIVPVCTCER